MNNEIIKIFKTIGLETNRDKSATNSKTCEQTATFLAKRCRILVPWIIENSKIVLTRESFEKIKAELFVRVERLCNTRLNAKNLVKRFNKHAISLINYYVGSLKLEPNKF